MTFYATKLESIFNKQTISFLVDGNTSYSVILRPNEAQLNPNPAHDSLAVQRYASHLTSRHMSSVSQSRQEEVLLHQQHQNALSQQAVSPVFYQQSPSAADVASNENHHPAPGQDDNGGNGTSTRKYSECQPNGHDTLSDFVTFVCQESEQNSQSQNHRNSPKSQQYTQYSTLPPMLPPLAIPVAIRSSDLNMVNSPPASITPPTTSSPHQKNHDMSQSDVHQSSPPLSPQSQLERKGLTRITSPYSNSRDYTFNHFHTQQAQVGFSSNLSA